MSKMAASPRQHMAGPLRLEKNLRDRANSVKTLPFGRTQSVEGVVRNLLPVIEEVKIQLRWDDIAEVLAEGGVAWKNGRHISGQDLRCIVHRLRGKTGGKNISPQASSFGMNEPKSGVSSMESLTSPATPDRPSPVSVETRHSRVLKEMARAAAERSQKG